jgi:cysteine synthase A
MRIYKDLPDAVGHTPLIRLKKASEITGCEILGKAEFLNPGQSVKDRAALWIIRDAMAKGTLRPGGTIVEGTAGNTGIGLALVGAAMGFKTVIVIPDTQSQEKKDMIRLAGANLVQVPAVPYKNPNNYVHYSGRLAAKMNETEPNGAIWAQQFDNTANRQAHIEGTAPEIWDQTDGKVDGFICAVGSGGTLAGVAAGLRERNPDVKIGLADPMGAALFNYYGAFQLLRPWRDEGRGFLDFRGHRPGPHHRESRRAGDRLSLPDPRRRGAAGGLRPVAGGGAVHGAVDRHQRRRGDPAGPRPRPWPHHRDRALRLWQPLSVEDLQPGLPARKRPANATLAGRGRGPFGADGFRAGLRFRTLTAPPAHPATDRTRRVLLAGSAGLG